MKLKIILVLSCFCVALCMSTTSEARMGGGRSFGSRGVRGFSSSPNRFSMPQQQPQQPYRPMSPAQPMSTPPGGGFLRGMMGGLAGGFLGSMLFRSLGYGGYGTAGGGGIGLFEILILAGLGFLFFRYVIGRAALSAGAPPMYSRPDIQQTIQDFEGEATQALRRYDQSFDLRRFKEGRMDDFFKIEGAWMHRDLSPVRPIIAPEMLQILESDVSDLKSKGHVNYLENIAVRETELVEAWQESGKEFANIRFRANLLDYTMDEKTNAVLAGNKDQPVKFEEYWTFVREAGHSDSVTNSWKLSAIEQGSA